MKDEKGLFYNKKFAWILTIAVCALSFFLGGARALNAEKNNILIVFENGEDDGGFSVSRDASEKAVRAQTMAVVAQKYNLTGADTLSDAVSRFLTADSPADKLNSTRGLDEIELMMYNKYRGEVSSIMNERDAAYWESSHSEILSRQTTIGHDPYFGLAVKFNAKLSKFPANVLKMFAFVKPLPI